MGGTVQVESEVGKGSKFKITLKTMCDNKEENSNLSKGSSSISDDNSSSFELLQQQFEQFDLE